MWVSEDGDWLTEVAPANGSAGAGSLVCVSKTPSASLSVDAQTLKHVTVSVSLARSHGLKET